MNISGSFGEVDKAGTPPPGKPSTDSTEKIVSRDIICRLYPLPFEYSPGSPETTRHTPNICKNIYVRFYRDVLNSP